MSDAEETTVGSEEVITEEPTTEDSQREPEDVDNANLLQADNANLQGNSDKDVPSPERESPKSSSAEKSKTQAYGSYLKDYLVHNIIPEGSKIKTPERSPEKSPASSCVSSPTKSPASSSVSSPVQSPEAKNVQLQSSSPTKAMQTLRLTSPVKRMSRLSAQQLGESQEQDTGTTSASTRSRATSFESPYNTRSKSKRTHEKEQRSASTDSAKKTNKEDDLKKQS